MDRSSEENRKQIARNQALIARLKGEMALAKEAGRTEVFFSIEDFCQMLEHLDWAMEFVKKIETRDDADEGSDSWRASLPDDDEPWRGNAT